MRLASEAEERVWLEPIVGNLPIGSVRWLGGTLVIQPWRLGVGMVITGLRHVRYGHRRIRVPPLSQDWLRQHESQAAKHQSDL